VVIHLDLNKTILAVDEVKNYGAHEVVYLEQWKTDAPFLTWAHETHGAGADKDSWVAELKVSKNEPQLIGYAHEYVTRIHLCICPSVHLSICPSVHLSICPSVHRPIGPSLDLSISPPAPASAVLFTAIYPSAIF